jgi:hypothetical protein
MCKKGKVPSPYGGGYSCASIPHHRVRDTSINWNFQVKKWIFKYIRWSTLPCLYVQKGKVPLTLWWGINAHEYSPIYIYTHISASGPVLKINKKYLGFYRKMNLIWSLHEIVKSISRCMRSFISPLFLFFFSFFFKLLDSYRKIGYSFSFILLIFWFSTFTVKKRKKEVFNWSYITLTWLIYDTHSFLDPYSL